MIDLYQSKCRWVFLWIKHLRLSGHQEGRLKNVPFRSILQNLRFQKTAQRKEREVDRSFTSFLVGLAQARAPTAKGLPRLKGSSTFLLDNCAAKKLPNLLPNMARPSTNASTMATLSTLTLRYRCCRKR